MSRLSLLKLVIFGVLPAVLLIGLVAYFLLPDNDEPEQEQSVEIQQPAQEKSVVRTQTIGQSVEGRDIVVTTFGDGPTHLLFVGGMHGGYEWNSSLLAYEMIAYFTAHPDRIPNNLTVNIIPSINPDGLAVVTDVEGVFEITDIANPDVRVSEGRFNANGVDLNRNFACKWAPKSTWKGKAVSAGTEAFSEPEAAALRDFVQDVQPKAVLFWHSKANNVYASECENGPLPATLSLMETYADAASYGKVAAFTAYPITGDAEGWLASIGIPSVTVELESANSTEWEQNKAGVEAVLKQYSVIE